MVRLVQEVSARFWTMLLFQRALGLDEIPGGEHDDMAGESKTKGVQGGALFAGLGLGAAGMLRTPPFDGGAIEAGAAVLVLR